MKFFFPSFKQEVLTDCPLAIRIAGRQKSNQSGGGKMAGKFSIPGGGSFTVAKSETFKADDVIEIRPRYPGNKTSQVSLVTLKALLKLLGAWIKTAEPDSHEGNLRFVTVKTVRAPSLEWGWTQQKDTFRFPLHLSDGPGGAAFGIRCISATLEINAEGWILEIQ